MKILFIYMLTISYIWSEHMFYPYSSQNTSLYGNTIVIINRRIVEKNENDINVSYPMLLGGDKSEKVNELIKNYIYGVVDEYRGGVYHSYDLFLEFTYEVTFLNENFISIRYDGCCGAIGNAGRGYLFPKDTINIDMEKGKVVNKEDIIKDEDGLFELLIQDRFEITGGRCHCPICITQTERKDEGIRAENLYYYINEGKFVIMQTNYHGDTIYSIGLDEVEDYLDEELVEKIYKAQEGEPR